MRRRSGQRPGHPSRPVGRLLAVCLCALTLLGGWARPEQAVRLTAGPAGSPSGPGPAVPEGPRAPGEPGKPGERGEPPEPERRGGAVGAVGPRAWPVGGGAGRGGGGGRPAVLRGWEPPPGPYAAGHRGVDLAARPGAPVRAAAPGRVAFAGEVAGRGVIAVELTGTGEPPLRITYQPVQARAEKGEPVTAGEAVGVLADGPFHCPVGCLHWGLLRGERYLDPLSLLPGWMLRGGPSRLLPVRGVPEPPA